MDFLSAKNKQVKFDFENPIPFILAPKNDLGMNLT